MTTQKVAALGALGRRHTLVVVPAVVGGVRVVRPASVVGERSPVRKRSSVRIRPVRPPGITPTNPEAHVVRRDAVVVRVPVRIVGVKVRIQPAVAHPVRVKSRGHVVVVDVVPVVNHRVRFIAVFFQVLFRVARLFLFEILLIVDVCLRFELRPSHLRVAARHEEHQRQQTQCGDKSFAHHGCRLPFGSQNLPARFARASHSFNVKAQLLFLSNGRHQILRNESCGRSGALQKSCRPTRTGRAWAPTR